MSGKRVTNFSESESTCVVCFKIVDAFSVGVCDHPVCFECSTRMRVLCNQMECPICRGEMPSVIFTKEIEPFCTLKPKVESQNLQERKYGIHFITPSLQRRYYRLLDHECHICRRNANNAPFKTFHLLKEHMRRSHDLFYCELCVLNLKIFTFERKCYTRVELATHRRKGDADNTSHRGHPLCEFCDTRFMDNDELFRHLRRQHMFCHFCDADGKHQYYNTYADLRKHYLDEHYLCEEGDCKHEHFTSVFRSDIDLKAHYASVHSRNLSKAANRQARTLELEFTLAPRMRPDGTATSGRHTRAYGSRNTARNESDAVVGLDTYSVEPGGPGGGTYENQIFSNPLAAENFPSLGGDASNTLRTVSNVTITSKINPLSDENFPTLGGAGSSKQSAVTITRTTVQGQHGLKRNLANFPVLGEASSGGSVRLSVNSNIQENPSLTSSKTPNVSIRVDHKSNGEITTRISQSAASNGQTVSIRPKVKNNAFPALSAADPKVSQPQWVQQKTKKQHEPKAAKVAPAPNLQHSSVNDFPSLNKSGKNDQKKVASSSIWVNLNHFNSNTTAKKNKVIAKSSKTIELVPPPTATDNNDSKSKPNKKKKPKVNDLVNSVNKIDINTNPRVEANHMPNGLSKKRSELNVEVTEPNVIVGYVNEVASTNLVNKPPPGFKLKPPPGLNNFTLSNNDLVFTSSSGQSYQIPTQQFFPPPHFKARNQFLIEKLKVTLHDADDIQQFKIYSDMFRGGEIQAEKYYEHCKHLMGKEFDGLFPELLVLLPNVQRQQDLYSVHRSKSGSRGLEACATCYQVVLKSDLQNHLSNHVLDNHFPVLNHAIDNNNVWNKK